MSQLLGDRSGFNRAFRDAVRLVRAGAMGVVLAATLSIGEGLLLAGRGTANAQSSAAVTADTTLETRVDVGANQFVPGPSFVVTGGTLRGNSLFHSFETFSPETITTEFDLTDSALGGVNNIFSRVTGSGTSNLNGLLQVTGGNDPNLFLLNPNGILVGPNANFFLPGSLFLSTAEQLSFEDGVTFSAADTTPSPLLTVSAPVGLQFGAQAAPIALDGRFSDVRDPQTGQFNQAEITYFRPETSVTLLGGEVEVKNTFLSAESGQIQIGSVGANTRVNFDAGTQLLSYAPNTNFDDITIDSSVVNVNAAFDGSGPGSGSLHFRGRDIDLQAANVSSDNVSSEEGGPINLTASGQITVENSRVTAAVSDSGFPSIGKGGDINITANQLRVLPTSKIGTDTYSFGQGGDVTIEAQEISFEGETDAAFFTNTPSVRLVSNAFGEGAGGNLTITADSMVASGNVFIAATTYPIFDFTGQLVFELDGNGQPILDSSGQPKLAQAGTGGNVLLNVGDLTIKDWAQLGTGTYSNADSGALTINADSFSIFDFVDETAPHPLTQVTTSVFGGSGKGGALTVNADTFSVAGEASISASTFPSFFPGVTTPAGDGGTLVFNVAQLDVLSGGQIGTGTFSAGDSGDLVVNATSGVNITGSRSLLVPDGSGAFAEAIVPSGMFISTERGATGDGGNLVVDTPFLRLSEGGVLGAGTESSGDAGNITIRANDIEISRPVSDGEAEQGGISASVGATGTGNGGQLEIVSDRLHLFDGGRITASTDGAGNAGSINVRSGVIEIEGVSDVLGTSSAIESSSSTAFDAGSVELSGDRINIRDRGTVSVSNLAGGSAGNVNLVANRVALNNGSIQAEANAGSQGNINIESRDVLLMREGSRLTTNATETATGGNISIDAPLIVGTENSDISANAVEGDGGNIQLVTQGLIGLEFRDEPTAESDITATSELGVNGTVNIESPNVDTDSGLVQLPENVEDASNQVVASCASQAGNNFASTGRGGLPNNPLTMLSSNQPWQDMRTAGVAEPSSVVSQAVVSPTVAFSEVDEIKEAGQWSVTAAGEVKLLAANAVEELHSDCLAQRG